MKRKKQTGRRLLAAAVALAAALAGCNRSDDGQRGAHHPAVMEPAVDHGQQPYLYGLIEEYQRMIAEDPHNLAATIGLANAYYDGGQWREAIKYYERALRLDPRNTDVITDMGTSYRNLGMPDWAIALYQKTLELEPGHQNALYNLGVVYAFDNKDSTSAARVWEKLLRLNPNHPHADHVRAALGKLRSGARPKQEQQ